MKLKTALLSGAGNTFHIASENDGSSFPSDKSRQKHLAKKICEEERADGFIFLKDGGAGKYKWFFYNNDGSDAEMCGNATRCVGYFIRNILSDKSQSIELETVAGPIKIKPLAKESFEISMTPIQELKSAHGFFCNTGVPHLIKEISDFKNFRSLKDSARALRFNGEFAPAGTNVTYVEKTNDKAAVKAVSYERGVEDFTEACGTGAMAAAFYNLKTYGVSETNVEMPGGTLIMNLTDLHRPIMTGPAVLLGTYEFEV